MRVFLILVINPCSIRQLYKFLLSICYKGGFLVILKERSTFNLLSGLYDNTSFILAACNIDNDTFLYLMVKKNKLTFKCGGGIILRVRCPHN